MRMLHVSTCLYIATVSACSTSSDVLPSTLKPLPVAEALRDSESADSNAPREIVLWSVPHALCTLRAASRNNGTGIELRADSLGQIQLWASSAGVSDVYILTCDEDGQVVQHTFDLANLDSDATLSALVHATSQQRPALSNPESLTQAELIARGYPPRPDYVRAPHAYRLWLEAVSRVMTLVPTSLVEVPGARLGTETLEGSDNWCGAKLTENSVRYIAVEAAFVVPTFSPVQDFTVGLWVGLGNSGIIQAGIYYRSEGSVGVYQAVHQFFDGPLVGNDLIQVRPGDLMYFWAWEGDSSCNVGPGLRGFGCFQYANATLGMTTRPMIRSPGLLPFSGETAEMIIERQPHRPPLLAVRIG